MHQNLKENRYMSAFLWTVTMQGTECLIFLDLSKHSISTLVLKETVETSVFGTEFVAMKQGIDALQGLIYKLRMMDIPISSPSYIWGQFVSDT